MSDSYAAHYPNHHKVVPLGTNPRKKYLVLFLVIILAATAGIVYYAYTSGLLSENNPNIPRQVIARINLERQAGNLPPVVLSQDLTADAQKTSRIVRVSPMGYQSGTGPENAGINIFVIPKTTWALSGYDSQQQLFATLETDDALFRENILNPAYDSVGIGTSGDSYNYYIVTIWD
jgi:uncharacterized protein YkwD